MKKMTKVFVIAVAMFATGTVFAGPHHHRHHRNEGLDLANGIVDLVLKVIAPTPVVVAPPPPPPVVVTPPPAPVVVAPAPAPVVVAPAPVVVAPPPPPRPVVVAPPRRHHRPAPPPRPHGRYDRGGHRR